MEIGTTAARHSSPSIAALFSSCVPAIVLISLTLGCRARQLQHDQADIRAAMLELYTDQIMDNLIRAHNGYPIVQLDYSRATGTITQTGSGAVGGSQTVTNARGGTLAVASRTIAEVLNYSLSAQQVNQLTVTAEPVLNNNEVYNAYLQFIKPDPDRGPRLLVSANPPPCDAAHIVRRCGELCYWIPKEFALDFLRLSLVTTVQRGQPLSIPRYFETTVVNVQRVDQESSELPDPDRATLLVTFAKKVPNDSGKIYVTLGNKQTRLLLLPYVGEGEIDPTKLTNRLIVNYSRFDESGPQLPVAQLMVQLENAAVRLKLDNYQPSIPTTENLIEDLRAELELIRLQAP